MMFWNTGITRSNTNKLLLILAIMLSAMILPSMEVHASLPRVRLDDLLIFGVFFLNVILSLFQRPVPDADLASRESKDRGIRAITKVFLLLLGSMILSNLYAVIFFKMPFGVRDIMEGVTLLKYYLAATLAISLNLQETEYSKLMKTFLAGLAFIIVLSWAQFLNIANVNAWLTPFFAQSHLDNLVNANPPRVLGTFDNPNVMGIFAVLALTIFTAMFYFRKLDSDRTRAVFLVVCVGLTLKLTFMTISRTAFLATAVTLVVLSLWALFKFSWKKETVIKVVTLFLLTLLIFYTSPRGFTTRLGEATDLQTSTSAQGHFLRAGDALQYIEKSPVFGNGTAKDSMTTLVDDEYVLITRRYGIIGLAAYFWLFLRPLKAALSRIRRHNFSAPDQGLGETKTMLCIAFVAATFAVFVYNLTAGIFYNLQLMTFFALFMGLIYRIEGETA